MPVENVRVKQLDTLSTEQIADNDLIIITDVSAEITKHSTVGSYRTYITNNVYSGSTNIPSSSVSVSSSYAAQAANSVSASSAVTSSHSLTGVSSSYSVTASFAHNFAGDSGTTLTTGSFYPINTSRSITGSNADTASHALNLVYAGLPNGTASFAISSSFAATASVVMVGGTVNMTASHAGVADWAYTSSYLYYDGLTPNGTVYNAIASTYATTAESSDTATRVANVFVFYGPYTSSADANLSVSHSYLQDTASFTPEEGDSFTEGWIYCRGTVTASFTSSATMWEYPRYVYLVLKNQLTETETILDTQHFTMNIFTLPDGNVISGSFTSAFDLAGYSSSLSESYSVYVSASKGVDFDFNRVPKFTIQTKASNFNVWGNDF